MKSSGILDAVTALVASASAALPSAETVAGLADDALIELQRVIAAGETVWAKAGATAAAQIAARSARTLGHSGLAQRNGYSEASKFVQSLTGSTIGEARRLVATGELLAGAGGFELSDAPGAESADAMGPTGPTASWGAVLADALRSGALTLAQVDAVRSELGAPSGGPAGSPPTVDDCARWADAARVLVDGAFRFGLTAEELRREARRVRARLDAAAIEEQRLERLAARSFRSLRRGDGMTQYTIVADPESAAVIDSAIDAALSPRLGGPRFVEAGARAAADELSADSRSREQHAFDIFLALFAAGVGTDGTVMPAEVSAEVRILVTRGELQRAVTDTGAGIAHIEGQTHPIGARAVLRHLCSGRFVPVLFDESGRALDVGRSRRLFAASQRIALAARDGGCMSPGCDRPPSQCEAHHIIPWSEGGGTSVDDGILLCRFHHLSLHNSDSRIERDNHGVYRLHRASTGEVIELRSKSGALGDLLQTG
ncbi:HNH endonuclease signature motif containing protein [Gryllotalpicola sp.]|uniref:HNH endonuclease signature motif containing protein n=1 Tax=Gryllotalpicola sp. TaxID=1932787 RepID=UPI00262A7891|nr:HNH endonuclease signature motif containing protein [Gryllotalpicola sp.]